MLPAWVRLGVQELPSEGRRRWFAELDLELRRLGDIAVPLVPDPSPKRTTSCYLHDPVGPPAEIHQSAILRVRVESPFARKHTDPA